MASAAVPSDSPVARARHRDCAAIRSTRAMRRRNRDRDAAAGAGRGTVGVAAGMRRSDRHRQFCVGRCLQQRRGHRARIFGRDARIDHHQMRPRARAIDAFGNRRGRARRRSAPDRSRSRPGRVRASPGRCAGSLMRIPIQRFSTGRPRSARHALLMQLVVEERLVVRDDDQHRHAIVHAGPQRGQTHQIVAVAQHCDRQPVAAAQRQRRADRHARPRADAAAAVEADVVLRMREAADTRLASPAASGCTRAGAARAFRSSPAQDRRAASQSAVALRRVGLRRRRSAPARPDEPRADGAVARARPSAATSAATSASGGGEDRQVASAAAPDNPCSSRCARIESSEQWITWPRGSSPAQACDSVPPRSTQSRLRITSASRIELRRVGPVTYRLGGNGCSGCCVGKLAPVLISVSTRASRRSASATRGAKSCGIVRHAADHQQRALRRYRAALARLRARLPAARTPVSRDPGTDRARAAARGAASALFLQRRVERHVNGPVRQRQSRCGTRAGSLRAPPRPIPAGRPTSCSRAPARPGRASVWIQSTHGRRLTASSGPTPPRSRIGIAVAPGIEDRHRRVHQADVRMQRDGERLAGDARVAVRECDRAAPRGCTAAAPAAYCRGG